MLDAEKIDHVAVAVRTSHEHLGTAAMVAVNLKSGLTRWVVFPRDFANVTIMGALVGDDRLVTSERGVYGR